MQILRIDSSTTGDQSISRKLTDELLAHFTAKHPEAKVIKRDLVAEPLPHIDPITTSAIRTPPETHRKRSPQPIPNSARCSTNSSPATW